MSLLCIDRQKVWRSFFCKKRLRTDDWMEQSSILTNVPNDATVLALIGAIEFENCDKCLTQLPPKVSPIKTVVSHVAFKSSWKEPRKKSMGRYIDTEIPNGQNGEERSSKSFYY
ncbi:hypothetical protein K0M31_003844 [Melipona bicolor]|uniref:Uncharacterized protein n=1 Tax=Melipona bicolor TaxID=60889 RepID=A0AA40FYG7_9HYME|nr:hypothetical protein K0M31_003844 [Melipona bicolor]